LRFFRKRLVNERPMNTCLRKTINGFKWRANRSSHRELMPIEKVAEVAGNDAVHKNKNDDDNDFKGYLDSACGSLKDNKLQNHESQMVKFEKKRNKAKTWQDHYYEKYQEANNDLIKDKAEYLKNRDSFAQQHGSYKINKWLYYVFLFILAVPELYLSRMVFESIAENDPQMRNIIAGTIAGSVPLAGHLFGIMLRQGNEEEGKVGWHKYLWIAFALVVLMLISVASAIRADFAKTYALWLSIPLFFSLNATILFVAILISYYRHNKKMLNAERKLNESKKNYNASERRTTSLEGRYLKAKLQYHSYQADIESSKKIIKLKIDDIEKEGKKRKHVYDLTYENVTEGLKQNQY